MKKRDKILTEKHKEKIRQSLIKYFKNGMPEATKIKLRDNARVNSNYGMKGKHHTQQAKNKIRKFRLGKHHSETTKIKISIMFRGRNHPFYNKHHTAESKLKMRLSVINNPRELAKRKKRLLAYAKGNTFYKDFLNRMTFANRTIWLKQRALKTSLGLKEYYKKHPERIKKIKKEKLSNTYNKDYLEQNPIWKKPDWNDHTPFKSVPEFIPIPKTQLDVIGQINYFTQGTIGPDGLL